MTPFFLIAHPIDWTIKCINPSRFEYNTQLLPSGPKPSYLGVRQILKEIGNKRVHGGTNLAQRRQTAKKKTKDHQCFDFLASWRLFYFKSQQSRIVVHPPTFNNPQFSKF